MEFDAIDALRDRHPAWRLLRAANASLVLSFLGDFFVDGNRGATAASEVASALDDLLYALNTDQDDPRFPKDPLAYLDDWAAADVAWLRRFYPPASDEVHYEVTPAFEKAFAWVESLRARPFVGTESRLHTVVELLSQIVRGSETDPEIRLAELRHRRDELDQEIASAEAGEIQMLEPASVRDRYQQVAATARELLSDFREVEDNFRGLDRQAREKIATWDGGKGELLADLVRSRADIAASDQGRTFQSFYDFLLSEARQDELSYLLARVSSLDVVTQDPRLRTIHHDWSEAAERAQRTVRQISEQLRRFLDDQIWLENRRVLDLVRDVETTALSIRDRPPGFGIEVDEPGIQIALPFDRPLYDARPVSNVESLLPPAPDEQLDTDLLFAQTFVDQARLAENIRALVPPRSSALLSDIVQFFPIEQGAAEIVGYLALQDSGVEIELDDSDETLLEFTVRADDDSESAGEKRRRARLPKVTVKRR